MTISAAQFPCESADLLRRAVEGEEIIITEQGQPVAKLVSIEHAQPDDERTAQAQAAIARIIELRKGNILGPDLSIRDLIDEGRRF